jgi:hypothetical protein
MNIKLICVLWRVWMMKKTYKYHLWKIGIEQMSMHKNATLSATKVALMVHPENSKCRAIEQNVP